VKIIELFPTLSHCIETLAKERFRHLVTQCIENEQIDSQLKDEIELLKAFLELTDFRKLRSESEKHLLEGKKVKFSVYWKEGKPHYQMIVT
jgi:hypothetical protein